MDLEIFFYGLVGAAPTFVVLLAGTVACVIYARRDPTACTLVGLAIVVALISRLVLPWLSTLVLTSFFQHLHAIRWRVVLNSLMFSIPNCAVWILLLWAIFGRLIRHGGPQHAGLLDEESESGHEQRY